jgi:hypothetical protein
LAALFILPNNDFIVVYIFLHKPLP